MVRRRHARVSVVHLQTLSLACVRRQLVRHEARHAAALVAVPPQRNVHEGLEVGSALLLDRGRVLRPVRLHGAPLHLPLGAAGQPVVVEEDAVEDTELRQASLPSTLNDPHIGLVRRPDVETLQDRVRTLDDGVRAWCRLLDALRAIAAAEADLEDVAVRIDAQLVDALLHVRLLPLHHHLNTIHVQQLLLPVLVLGEEETVGPLHELGQAATGYPSLRSTVPLPRHCFEGIEHPALRAGACRLGVLCPVLRIRAPLHLASAHFLGPTCIEKDAVERPQLRQDGLPRALDHRHAGLVLRPGTESLEHHGRTLDDDVG
mmetsp:Transcript_73695/g.240020  ORF Transcript_73695/g.240020 Transcript_73695/m.240020 type:complete len:317 (+) Transcript_73695:878-1828(+)